MRPWHRTGVVFTALLTQVGCSGATDALPREPISGTVTFAGQPLKKGSIQFLPGPSSSTVASGGIIIDGKFSVSRGDGPVPGRYKVMIFAEGVSTSSSAEGDRARKAQEKKAKHPDGLIPLRYNLKTELEKEVKSGGPNQYAFDLEK